MPNTEKKIQNLVDICEDAREFYTDATEQTDDPEMKRLFRTMADIRKSVIIDLRAHMREQGMDVEEPSETMMGQINKFLGENIAKWRDSPDTTLIAYLEEAEDRCLRSFKDVANDNDISLETRALLNEELTTLQKTHDYMKELKDATSNA